MSEQEILYKILNEIGEVKTKVAVIETKQDIQISNHLELAKDQIDLKKNHYKLEKDFTSLKTKFLLVTGFLGSIFGLVATAVYNFFTGK